MYVCMLSSLQRLCIKRKFTIYVDTMVYDGLQSQHLISMAGLSLSSCWRWRSQARCLRTSGRSVFVSANDSSWWYLGTCNGSGHVLLGLYLMFLEPYYILLYLYSCVSSAKQGSWQYCQGVNQRRRSGPHTNLVLGLLELGPPRKFNRN